MFRLQCFAMVGGLLSILVINASATTTEMLSGYARFVPQADTVKYGDNESQDKVMEYRDPSKKTYNKGFADIMKRLDSCKDVFYMIYHAAGYHGEFFYDGQFLRIVIRDPGQVYGTKDGTDAILFEEVKHAEQFLDGKTFFENRNSRWVCIGNLQLEVEAKMFVANTLKIHPSWEYTDSTTNKVYTLPSILWSLKQAGTDKERYRYLRDGVKIPFGTDIKERGYIAISATYPEASTDLVNNSCSERIRNNALFCYPSRKMRAGH